MEIPDNAVIMNNGREDAEDNAMATNENVINETPEGQYKIDGISGFGHGNISVTEDVMEDDDEDEEINEFEMNVFDELEWWVLFVTTWHDIAIIE